MTNNILMSQKKIDDHGILKKLIDKEINGTRAAKLLKLCVRHVRRLKKKVKLHGAKALIHGNTGKRGNRAVPEDEQEKIKKLLTEKYHDFGPTFAAEKLREEHRIDRDPKTIRAIQIGIGLWKQKTTKPASTHRAWRVRRSAEGEMLQYDGSYEKWFEDRAPKCCLLAAIDDATGKIKQLVLGEHEGVFPTFSFWKKYIETHGKPHSIYTDKFSTYKMNSAIAKENHDLKTQFQRACDEIRIELIFANSPQAKGRVERFFETSQDRLIKELRLAGISTIKEANIFLERVFIPKFNAKFAVHPTSSENLHVPMTEKELARLNIVFSRQEKRIMQNDFTVSFKSRWYQIGKIQPVTVQKKDEITVEEWTNGTVHLRLRGKELQYEVLPDRPKRVTEQPLFIAASSEEISAKKAHAPAADHPWRNITFGSKRKLKTCSLGHF